MISVFKLHIPVECVNIIKSQKSATKNIVSVFVLSVYPPGKIKKHLLKNAFQKRNVGLAVHFLINFENPERRPGVNGWIYIAEIPFISRQLPIWVHIPFLRKQL